MRTHIIALLGILTWTAPVLADVLDLPHITVDGRAKTEVVPDQMRWYLTVEKTGRELPTVADEHTKAVQQVLDFLRDTGIQEADVQTTRMEFGENLVYRNETSVKEGYRASTDVCFQTLDLKKYRTLWIGLAQLPGVSVDGIYYDHSKRIEYQNETRRKALLAARDKAKDLARTLGSDIAEPLMIEEDSWEYGGTVNYFQGPDRRESDDDEGLALGKIAIRMKVRVTFRLMTHDE